MLERLEINKLVWAVSMLSSCASRYMYIQMNLRAGKLFNPNITEERDFQSPYLSADIVENIAKKLGMRGVARSAQHLKKSLENYGRKMAPADVTELTDLINAFNVLLTSFGNEMDGTELFIMTGRLSHHFEENGHPFGENVANSFPNCAYDIDEARKCLALQRSTACGFHLMRAAEGAAYIILQHLEGNPTNEDGEQRPFGSLVVEIGKAVDAMARGARKDSWMRLKGFLAACNRGFRTKIAHPGIAYTAEEAEKLFGLTESLMQEGAELLRL